MDTGASEYRAFLLDANGGFIRRYEFEALNDDAATLHARQYVAGHDVEVWRLHRMVSVLRHRS
jgi:hypothetical protein